MPPDVPDHEDVDLHLIPDLTHNSLEIRVWYESKLIRSFTLPLDNIKVHF